MMLPFWWTISAQEIASYQHLGMILGVTLMGILFFRTALIYLIKWFVAKGGNFYRTTSANSAPWELTLRMEMARLALRAL
jgi:hypothetical protein